MPSDPIVPDHIRAAIHAGHVGQVAIFCDRCGIEETADYTGETREIRLATARKHLADTKAWTITEAQDLCPKCNLPDQPDGIEDDSRDLPNPVRAADRVGQYICAAGDGLYDIQGGAPLYARDLEALTRTATKLAELQEELSRRTHTLDLARRELGATREEADRFAAELASANQQIATTKAHFTRRTDTLTTRAERAEAERDQAQGYAEAVARLRDDERYLIAVNEASEVHGRIRHHLADYLETVGPDGIDVTTGRWPAREHAVPVAAQPLECSHQAGCPVHGDVRDCEPIPAAAGESQASYPAEWIQNGMPPLDNRVDDSAARDAFIRDGHADVTADESQASEPAPAAPKRAQGGIIRRDQVGIHRDQVGIIRRDVGPILAAVEHTPPKRLQRLIAEVQRAGADDVATPRFHIGRSWSGHTIEDACPCPQEPCGLVSTRHPDCTQHGLSRSIRQGHPADRCPGAQETGR